MSKINDHGSWHFEERRKFLNRLVNELEDLANTPSPIRRVVVPIEIPSLLYQLASMVEMDNTIMESNAKWNVLLRTHLKKIDSTVFSLADSIREIKGKIKDLDTSKLDSDVEDLRKEVAEFRKYKATFEIMQSLAPDLQKAIDNVKKMKEDNR